MDEASLARTVHNLVSISGERMDKHGLDYRRRCVPRIEPLSFLLL